MEFHSRENSAFDMGEVRWSQDGHALASRSGRELHVSLAPRSDSYLAGIMEGPRIAVISYRQQSVADSHQLSFYDSNCELMGSTPFAGGLAACSIIEVTVFRFRSLS
jgi:hypothetical protein